MIMVETIKQIRVDIDGLSQLVVELKTYSMIKGNNTPSLNLIRTINSLNLAKAWLGKLLGELGTENPYGSGYKTVEDIRPTADTSHPPIVGSSFEIDWSSRSFIGKIDLLRYMIELTSEEVKNLELLSPVREMSICRTSSWENLCEARFHLGFELGEIKDRG